MFEFFKKLPVHIQAEVYSHLSVSNTKNVASVSKEEKKIMEEDIVWKKHLIEDFHFTQKGAIAIKEKLNLTYKHTYRFCKNYQLNENQKKVLALLKTYGLVENHLKGRDWFNSHKHELALTRLVCDERFSPSKAILEIEGLDYVKVGWIASGLFRAELSALSKDKTGNYTFKIFALSSLKKHGLELGHLLGCEWFDSVFHTSALEHLIEVRKFSPKEAMNEIFELNSEQIQYLLPTCKPTMTGDQVRGLSKLRIDFMKKIRNEHNIRITSDDLRKCHKQPSNDAEKAQLDNLLYLLVHEKISINDAISENNKIDFAEEIKKQEEAWKQISEKLRREQGLVDVENLTSDDDEENYDRGYFIYN